jgi:trehalose 6-phosphate synthase
VLSRFAGAAEIFDGAIEVNPFDTDETAEALRIALDMTLDERISRWTALMAAAREHNVEAWAARFLDRLAPATIAASGTRDILYLASVA